MELRLAEEFGSGGSFVVSRAESGMLLETTGGGSVVDGLTPVGIGIGGKR